MNRRSLLKFLSAIPALGVAACGGMRPVKAAEAVAYGESPFLAATKYAEALAVEHQIDGHIVPQSLWNETLRNWYIAFGTANIHEYANDEGRIVRDLVSLV